MLHWAQHLLLNLLLFPVPCEPSRSAGQSHPHLLSSEILSFLNQIPPSPRPLLILACMDRHTWSEVHVMRSLATGQYSAAIAGHGSPRCAEKQAQGRGIRRAPSHGQRCRKEVPPAADRWATLPLLISQPPVAPHRPENRVPQPGI